MRPRQPHLSSLTLLFVLVVASICSLGIDAVNVAEELEHLERDAGGEIVRDYAARTSGVDAVHVDETHGDDEKDQTNVPIPRTKRGRKRNNKGRRRCSANQMNQRCLACEKLVKESYQTGECSPWNFAGYLGMKNCQTLFKACAVSRIKQGCRNGRRQFRRCNYRSMQLSEPYNPEFKYYVASESRPAPAPTIDPNCDPNCAPCCDVEEEEYWEAFEAEVVIDCEEEDVIIEPSADISDAFQEYFKAQEDCGVFDNGKFDGCYPRNILTSAVETIENGACEDAPLVSPGGRFLQDKVQASVKRRRKNKKLKMRGRNQKRGRCRGKCASRSKANDAIGGDPNRRFLRDVVTSSATWHRELDEQGICRAENSNRRGLTSKGRDLNFAEPPSLVNSLNKVQSKTGFSSFEAAGTKVFEFSCDKGSDASQCSNGSHLCCGLSGCSCDASSPSHESCVRGTQISDRAFDSCYLSSSGALGEENLCCADPSNYAPECKGKCQFTDSPTAFPTTSPTLLPTFNCELELSYNQAYNAENDNIDIWLKIVNMCPRTATVANMSVANYIQCPTDAKRNCTPLLPITDIFISGNENSDELDPEEIVVIQLNAPVDDRSRQGEVCDYTHHFDYDAIGYTD